MRPARKAIDPEDRLDAAIKTVKEAFKGKKLTMKDINSAVTSIRRKSYGKKSRTVI